MDAYTATTFSRHQRPLRALMLEGQAWFCLQDLGRLMGTPYPERKIHRLDSDQHREVCIKADGQWRKSLLVSESGAITLIVRNQIPENRSLRRWLTLEVVPALRETGAGPLPAMTAMSWQGGPLSVLYWHDEPWVKLRDMPGLMPASQLQAKHRWWSFAE